MTSALPSCWNLGTALGVCHAVVFQTNRYRIGDMWLETVRLVFLEVLMSGASVGQFVSLEALMVEAFVAQLVLGVMAQVLLAVVLLQVFVVKVLVALDA